VRANGKRAREYSFKHRSKGYVASNLRLETEIARTWAGLDIEAFEALPGNPQFVNPFVPKPSKAEIIAAYRMTKLMETIQADISSR
jgi:hypothetical protein